MKMWILVNKKEFAVSFHLDDIIYHNLNATDKIKVLVSVLKNEFEVYYRERHGQAVEVCVYNNEYKEFITEDGFGECNLDIFWKECVEELILLHNERFRLNPAL
jgi:hypothetical protein